MCKNDWGLGGSPLAVLWVRKQAERAWQVSGLKVIRTDLREVSHLGTHGLSSHFLFPPLKFSAVRIRASSLINIDRSSFSLKLHQQSNVCQMGTFTLNARRGQEMYVSLGYMVNCWEWKGDLMWPS